MTQLKSINPFNQQQLTSFEEMTPAEVDAAIARADDTRGYWVADNFSLCHAAVSDRVQRVSVIREVT